MARSEDAKAPLARLAFANGLFELQTTQNGTKQWAATLLWPKSEDISSLHKLAVAAATAEWGDKAVQMIKDKLIHSPFLDGDGPQGKSKKTGEAHAGFPGHTFIRVISGEQYKPVVIDRKKIVVANRDVVYSGCYGYAVVNAFTWENKEKGKGISFGISMFQLAKDGEKLGGGGVDIDKWAETIEDEGLAPDSTKGGAGASGLFA